MQNNQKNFLNVESLFTIIIIYNAYYHYTNHEMNLLK